MVASTRRPPPERLRRAPMSWSQARPCSPAVTIAIATISDDCVGQVDGGKRNGGSRLENENKAARPATLTIRDPAPAARLFAEDILLPQPALPRWASALRTGRHSLKSA